MEPIANLLPNATGKPSPSPTTTPTELLPPSWKAAFSERMRSLFRQAWTSQWSTPAEYERLLADYTAMLARLTPEQIRAGLDACVGRTYPPNPSEFYGLATAKTSPTTASHQPYKALPKPPRDPAKTAERFADLRAALRRDEYLPAA
jgi:hypothetical protein